MNVATPAAEGRTTLYHRRHAKQQAAKTLGHIAPALVLFFGVVPILMGEEHLTFLGALEIAVGAAYLALMVRELRHLRHNPFHREPVAWLELAAAGILALESYHIWHRHHAAELAGAPHRLHVLPWLYAAVALMYVVLAFRLNKLTDRQFLHLRADGFAVRTRRVGPRARTDLGPGGRRGARRPRRRAGAPVQWPAAPHLVRQYPRRRRAPRPVAGAFYASLSEE